MYLMCCNKPKSKELLQELEIQYKKTNNVIKSIQMTMTSTIAVFGDHNMYKFLK